jgi:hypothetical protein
MLTQSYILNQINPLQIAGDDTIPGVDGSYSYNSFIRNIENL